MKHENDTDKMRRYISELEGIICELITFQERDGEISYRVRSDAVRFKIRRFKNSDDPERDCNERGYL